MPLALSVLVEVLCMQVSLRNVIKGAVIPGGLPVNMRCRELPLLGSRCRTEVIFRSELGGIRNVAHRGFRGPGSMLLTLRRLHCYRGSGRGLAIMLRRHTRISWSKANILTVNVALHLVRGFQGLARVIRGTLTAIMSIIYRPPAAEQLAVHTSSS